MSDQNSSEVIEKTDEKNPISEKLNNLSADFTLFGKKGKNDKAEYLGEKLADVDKADNKFKALMIALNLYETSSNQEEVDKLQGEINKAKEALKAAGFEENSPIVQGAIKGLSAELTKANSKVTDNLPSLANYFGVKLAKGTAHTVHESTGQLAMFRPDLAYMRQNDFIFRQSDKTAVIVHSQTVATEALESLKIKPASDTWLAISYNGEFQHTRKKTDDLRMMADIIAIPENWLGIKPVTYTSDKPSLSGLTGKVATTLGLQYNGNGWQSFAEYPGQFDKIQRIVKEQ